jgi:hypothetical protein
MKPKNPEFIWSVLLVLGMAIGLGIWGPNPPDGNPLTKAKLIFAYAGIVLIFLFGFFVLAAIASGKIPIDTLLAEKDGGGGASMSRFQLLIFIFVVATSFFAIVIGKGEFPQVPTGVLTLLGISATTYGVSKAIQQGSADGNGGGGTDTTTTTASSAGQGTTASTTTTTTSTTAPNS